MFFIRKNLSFVKKISSLSSNIVFYNKNVVRNKYGTALFLVQVVYNPKCVAAMDRRLLFIKMAIGYQKIYR